MENCSKKDMQRQGGLIRPSSVLLTTGLLMMAASPMLAAGGTGLDNGPKIESIAQNGKTVTVKVSDSAGELIGANVIVKGTTNGNVTDFNGQVTLQDVPANAILEISYIGYITKEVPVGNQTNINVTLEEDSKRNIGGRLQSPGRGSCSRLRYNGKETGDQLCNFFVRRRHDERCGRFGYHHFFAR